MGRELPKPLLGDAGQSFQCRIAVDDLTRSVTDEGWIRKSFEQSSEVELASRPKRFSLSATLYDPKISSH